MRLQHNMPPPPSGRGSSGTRKRKRSLSPSHPQTNAPAPEQSAFSTFKLEPQTPSELDHGIGGGGDYFSGLTREEDDDEDDGEDDGLPPHLQRLLDPRTGLIMGRSPALVMYIIQKAKMRYALETHTSLIEELRCAALIRIVFAALISSHLGSQGHKQKKKRKRRRQC
jgi:hypothetical protein